MKHLIIFMILLLTFFAVPCFLPSPEAYAEAKQVGFSDEQIEIGRQYALQRQMIFWPSTILNLALLTFLTAQSRRLADACSRWVHGWWLPSLLLVGLVCFVLEEAINLPFGLIRLEHARAWNMTTRSTADWLQQHFLALAVYGGISALVLTGFYLLLLYLPRTWWLACSLAVPLLLLAGTILQPLALAPLFNTFVPLDQSQWKDLKPAVEQILRKAEVNVAEVLVVDASRQGSHTNAYFTGHGPARRIVLYDTLLKDHTPQEVESILAHELGHWLHHDIDRGIIFISVAAFFAFCLLFLFLRWMHSRPPCYLKNAADPAGLPLLLLVFALAGWVMMPIQNLYSRSIERHADEESLILADHPQAFVNAEKRLAATNLSRLDPHPLLVFLYYTHPPVVKRIQMALDWEKH